jgi:hypothetical protein
VEIREQNHLNARRELFTLYKEQQAKHGAHGPKIELAIRHLADEEKITRK